MYKTKGYEIYSEDSGLEIRESYKKEGDGNGSKRSGRITLRFFTMGDIPLSWRFIMTPKEAYSLHLKTIELVRNGGKASLSPHRFENKEDGEVISILSLEKWEKEEKQGYAVTLKRREDSINVSMDVYDLLFLGNGW